MTRVKDTPHLKLLQFQGVASEPSQLALFSLPSPRLAVFAPMSGISGQLFLRTLEALQPRMLLDIRVLPRFDLPGLTRAMAFQVFEEQRLAYRDITGLLKVSSRRDARMNAAVMADELGRLLPGTIQGPVLFLTEGENVAAAYSQMIPRQLSDRFRDWDVKVGWLSMDHEPA
jgi:hypothetical protein